MLSQHYLEPRVKLKDILIARGLDAKSFITVDHGDVVAVEDGS